MAARGWAGYKRSDPMTLSLDWYRAVKLAVVAAGYSHEIEWATGVGEPLDPDEFAAELAYVICNSGMRQQTARKIFDKVDQALRAGDTARSVFNHDGKARAIDDIWARRAVLLADYLATGDKLEWLAAVAWIGPITKYHAAKNFGVDTVKPDRHLVRISEAAGETPAALCGRLAKAAGDRVGVVDLVIWRAANLGVLDTLHNPGGWPVQAPPPAAVAQTDLFEGAL